MLTCSDDDNEINMDLRFLGTENNIGDMGSRKNLGRKLTFYTQDDSKVEILDMDLGPPQMGREAETTSRARKGSGKWHATHDINVGLGPLRVTLKSGHANLS
jgi:hypothetical protein